MYTQPSNNGFPSGALYYQNLGWNYGLQVNMAELITVEWAIHLCYYNVSHFIMLVFYWVVSIFPPQLAIYPYVSCLQLLSSFTMAVSLVCNMR